MGSACSAQASITTHQPRANWRGESKHHSLVHKSDHVQCTCTSCKKHKHVKWDNTEKRKELGKHHHVSSVMMEWASYMY